MNEKLEPIKLDLMMANLYELLKNILSTDVEIETIIEIAPEFSGPIKTFFAEPHIREVAMPFMKATGFYFRNVLNANKKGNKIAWVNFNFVPAILYAMDVVPLSAEVIASFQAMLPGGANEAIDYCKEIGMPETMCTAQMGGVGTMLRNLTEKPDMAINAASGSCDTNSKNFEFLSEYLHIPFCNIDAPPYYDEGGPMTEYYRAEFRKLVSFLEEQTGNKLDEGRLREVCKEVKKQDEYVAEIYELRKAVPNPLPAVFNLILFGTRFMAAGTPEATEVLKTMYDVTKERYKRGEGVLPEERVRAGFCYLSHFGGGGEFWRWFEHNGVSLVMEALALFNQHHYRIDTSTVDTMLDSLADQSSNMPMTKQIRGPYDYPGQWYDDVVTVGKDLKIDCGIYLGTMGCKNTWGCVKVLMKRLEEDLGIPTLIIQSDSWDDRVTPWPSIRDQIEEFINTVVLGTG